VNAIGLAITLINAKALFIFIQGNSLQLRVEKSLWRRNFVIHGGPWETLCSSWVIQTPVNLFRLSNYYVLRDFLYRETPTNVEF